MNPEREHPFIGRIVEALLVEKGMSKAEYARRICTSRQNVSLVLKRQTFDTLLLWRTSKALDVDLFHLMSVCLSEGQSMDDGFRHHPPVVKGTLDIRLEIADTKLVQLTADLVRRIIEEHRPGKGDEDSPEAPQPVRK